MLNHHQIRCSVTEANPMFRRLVVSVLALIMVSAGLISAQPAPQSSKLEEMSRLYAETLRQQRPQLYYDLLASTDSAQAILNADPNIELMYIDANGVPRYYMVNNLDAARTISTDKVWSGLGVGYPLDGSSTLPYQLAIWDGGAVLPGHMEFYGRVFQRDDADIVISHATHVAGTMIAGGWVDAATGMSRQAVLDAYDWHYDNSEMAIAANAGLKVSNHSYGYACGWFIYGGYLYWAGDKAVSETEDYSFGYYGNFAKAWDEIAAAAPYYLIIKSVGNDRNDTGPSPGEGYYFWDPEDSYWEWTTGTPGPDCGPDGFDCIPHISNAKNILTVGAVYDIVDGYADPSDVIMSSFSGWGPTDDGRIKPDIVANGIELYSTSSEAANAYDTKSGTSMSAPSVAGSVNLLVDHFRNTHGGISPLASTMKALVIQTADECGEHPGPDYKFGWGLMNTRKAAQVITNDVAGDEWIVETTLNNGDVHYYVLDGAGGPGTAPIRVTIAWTDPPGTPPSYPQVLDITTPMLVHDLDIRLVHLESSGQYSPYVLNPDAPEEAATDSINDLDNVEQIYMAEPLEGTYQLTVSHKGALNIPQSYSIISTHPLLECIDTDSDAICDMVDLCPDDFFNDADGDGICGDVDNCPNSYNPDQGDVDGDGAGNACDHIVSVPGNYATIQEAIDVVLEGDTVEVSGGLYSGPGNTNLSFSGKSITVRSVPGAGGEPATIVCQGSEKGFIFDEGEDPNSRLVGFTILSDAGAIRLESSTHIDSCEFRPYTGSSTSAIQVNNGSVPVQPLITNCRFLNCRSTSEGGAIWFGMNAAATVDSCAFEGCTAIGFGGAIFVTDFIGIDASITNSVFDGNHANLGGGAVAFSGQINLTGNTFVNNTSGGGLYEGALWVGVNPNFDFTLNVERCNFAQNQTYAINVAGGSDIPTFVCNNLWQNTGGDFHPSSIVQAGDLDATNSFVDPRFCNFANADYTVHWDSRLWRHNNTCGGDIGGFDLGCTYTPALASPADGGGVPDHVQATLYWHLVPLGGSSIQYRVEVDQDPNFGSPDRQSYWGVSDTSWTIGLPLLDNVEYYWRVQAKCVISGPDPDVIGPWSAAWSFTPYSQPILSCPILYVKDGTGMRRENPLFTSCATVGYAQTVTDYYHVKSFTNLNPNDLEIQIREEEDETAYIDQVELITVDHPEQTEVAVAIDGSIVVYEGAPAISVYAVDHTGVDVTKTLRARDGELYRSSESGHITAKFINQGVSDRFVLSSATGFCLPMSPPEDPLPGPAPAVRMQVLDNTGAWVEFSGIPSREDASHGFIISVPSQLISGVDTVTVKLSWTGSYETDAITHIMPSGKSHKTKAWEATVVRTAPFIEDDRNIAIDGRQSMARLTKGGSLGLTFEIDEPVAEGQVRDYVVKATGRYVPLSLSASDGSLPLTFALHQNYPNPFNPTTTISLSLPSADHVKVEILNIVGQKVITLADREFEAGRHQIVWNGLTQEGQPAASGVYFYRVQTTTHSETRKMMLLK